MKEMRHYGVHNMMFEFQHSILSSLASNEYSSPSLSLSFNSLLFFMQDPHNSHSRKRWYHRAIEATMLWKALSIPIDLPFTLRKTTRKLRKCTSTRVSSSFTHVCLCAPISSYTDIFQAAVVPPRRSFSYPRSRSTSSRQEISVRAPKMGVEGRKIFRGKSLTDDVLMRRFVVDEEAMRRRNEMEIIRRRSGMRKRKIGPSPLGRMVLAIQD